MFNRRCPVGTRPSDASMDKAGKKSHAKLIQVKCKELHWWGKKEMAKIISFSRTCLCEYPFGITPVEKRIHQPREVSNSNFACRMYAGEIASTPRVNLHH
jgi:hypothetical protein